MYNGHKPFLWAWAGKGYTQEVGMSHQELVLVLSVTKVMQELAKFEGCNKRRMRDKRWQLNKRRGCLLSGGSNATGGGGSMRGGGAGWWEVTQQPAKEERLHKRQSQQTGGYATTSQVGVVRQQADGRQEAVAWQEATGVPADGRPSRNRRRWLDERQKHWRMGDNATTSQRSEA